MAEFRKTKKTEGEMEVDETLVPSTIGLSGKASRQVPPPAVLSGNVSPNSRRKKIVPFLTRDQGRNKRQRKKRKAEDGRLSDEEGMSEWVENVREEMKKVRNDLREIVNKPANEIDFSVIEAIMNVADGYEGIVNRLLCENEKLRGKISGMDEMKKDLIDGMNARAECIENDVSKKVVDGVKKMVKRCMYEEMKKVRENLVNVGMDVQKDEKNKPTYAVILKGKEGEDSEVVKEKFKQVIGKETSVRVKAVKTTKDGGIAVEMVSVNDKNELLQNESLKSTGVKMSEARRIMPRMIVYDVPEEWNDGYVLEEMYKRNVGDSMDPEEYKGRVKIVMRNGKRGSNVMNVVVECPFEMRERLVRMGRVFVDTHSFRVNVFEKVFRCYNCYGFGHRARECKEKEVCRKCGCEGHKGDSCRKSEACRNCTRKGKKGPEVAHSVLSPECPEYKWRLGLLRERTDYT